MVKPSINPLTCVPSLVGQKFPKDLISSSADLRSYVKTISAFIWPSSRILLKWIGVINGEDTISWRPSIKPLRFTKWNSWAIFSLSIPIKLTLAPTLSNGNKCWIKSNTSCHCTVILPITTLPDSSPIFIGILSIGLNVIIVPW